MIIHLLYFLMGMACYAFIAWVYSAFADYWRVRFFDKPGVAESDDQMGVPPKARRFVVLNVARVGEGQPTAAFDD